MFEYSGKLIRVVDGDTMHVELDLGFDLKINATLRLYGVNTPEMRTPEGPVAKRVTEEWFISQSPTGTVMMEAVPVKIRTIKDHKEKYGRYLAIIYPYNAAVVNPDDGTMAVGSLNAALIMRGWTYGVKS